MAALVPHVHSLNDTGRRELHPDPQRSLDNPPTLSDAATPACVGCEAVCTGHS